MFAIGFVLAALFDSSFVRLFVRPFPCLVVWLSALCFFLSLSKRGCAYVLSIVSLCLFVSPMCNFGLVVLSDNSFIRVFVRSFASLFDCLVVGSLFSCRF